MAYDILIKSGAVLDGTGTAPTFTDIGISGDKIAAIGNLGENAKVTINAFGKIVAPGFIDITNHSDTHLTLFKYPGQESMLMQGVTTAIGGNCGASLAPLGAPGAINAIRKWADPSEININWATMGEFLTELSYIKLGVNFATFVGYGTLRRGVMGDEVKQLTLEEKEQIKMLLENAVREGAWGLSLGLAYGHERVSTTEEIIDICRVLSQTGGIVKIHLRSEGLEILASINEAVRIARETGVPVQISHLKSIGRKSWPMLAAALELIARARNSGVNINFDVSPYRTTGSLLYLLIPAWARAGGFLELFKRLDNPVERKKIIEALKIHTLHYDKILVTSAENTASIVGHTLAEIAEEGGISPEEALLSAVRANGGRVKIIGRTVSMKNTRMEIAAKNSFIASDGAGYSQDAIKTGDLVHPRSFGAFPRFLGRFAEDLKISLPEAIRKITSGPAEKLGLDRRGAIKKGHFADITVFDPKIIRDRATYKNPYHYPVGVEWVVVNGQIAVEQGKITGVRVGKVLHRI